jgi:Domain of unknown function (DUF4349)
MGTLGDRTRVIGIGVTLVVVGVLAALSLMFIGGQTSSVLSTVGAAIQEDGTGVVGAVPAPAVDGQVSGEGTPDQRSAYDTAAVLPQDDLKVVYTGSLQLVVADLQASLAKARTTVESVGGYIGASQESNDGDRSVATITYRIPAAHWEDAIASLRGIADSVVSEQTQATEVGGQLVDLDARIRNLQASEAALQEIARGSGRVSDLLQVQAQLTDVRGQIEQLQAQQAQLTDQVAYGSLVTTFGLQVQQVQDTARAWDPASEVDAAMASLISIGQTVASAAIWLAIVWLPIVLLFAVLALIAYRLLRRFIPRAMPSRPIEGWDA